MVAASPETPVPSRLAVPAHSEDGRVSRPAQSLPTVWDSSYLGPCARWAFFPWLLLKLSLDLFIASFQGFNDGCYVRFSLCLSCLWSVEFLGCEVYTFRIIWKTFGHDFLRFSFLPPSGPLKSTHTQRDLVPSTPLSRRRVCSAPFPLRLVLGSFRCSASSSPFPLQVHAMP